MMLAGDEFGRTQYGNNNAYCQDNEISWVDWTLAQDNAPLLACVRKLCALRHRYPILRRNLFLNGEYIEELGVRDVTWINPDGAQMTDTDWHDPATRCFGMLLDGRAQTTGIRQHGKEATILIVINGRAEDVGFTVPACAGAGGWSLLIDTTAADCEGSAPVDVGTVYTVSGRSLLLFVLESAPAQAEE
jgi:glycogen operon protein